MAEQKSFYDEDHVNKIVARASELESALEQAQARIAQLEAKNEALAVVVEDLGSRGATMRKAIGIHEKEIRALKTLLKKHNIKRPAEPSAASLRARQTIGVQTDDAVVGFSLQMP